jgi:hypothetical protein
MLLALKAMVGAFAWRCVCANSRRQPEHTSPPPPPRARPFAHSVSASPQIKTADFVFFMALAAVCFSGFAYAFYSLNDAFTLREILWIMLKVWFGNSVSFWRASLRTLQLPASPADPPPPLGPSPTQYVGFDAAAQISEVFGPGLMGEWMFTLAAERCIDFRPSSPPPPPLASPAGARVDQTQCSLPCWPTRCS